MPIFEYVCRDCQHPFEAIVARRALRCARSANPRLWTSSFRCCGIDELTGAWACHPGTRPLRLLRRSTRRARAV